MKLLVFVFICVISVISAKTTQKLKHDTKKLVCEGVHVHGKLHKRHVIMNGINRPYQLAMYNNQHKIFFSYNVGEDTEDTFEIAYVKINDTMPTEIKEIKNGFAVAVDEHDGIAFFGGNNGIYSDNLTESDGLKHIVKDRDIWDMFFKHNLYFIQYPSQRLHKYDMKEKNVTLQEHIHEKIYQFAIDGDGDTFITTRDGLFEIKAGTNHRVPYEGPKIFRAIEVNHKGVAHFCAKSAIYVADKTNHTLKEIASIKNIFGLTFDGSDNIIYSNPHEIVKLLPHDSKCMRYQESSILEMLLAPEKDIRHLSRLRVWRVAPSLIFPHTPYIVTQSSLCEYKYSNFALHKTTLLYFGGLIVLLFINI